MNVAYIPVRGGSKSIPLKNIKLMAGKPLVWWSAKAACECEAIDKVYVCTDSAEIRKAVETFGFSKLEIIGRSDETATDTASTESAILEFASNYDFDNIVLIQATSPLVTVGDLDKGFALIRTDKADSVLSVVLQKRFLWQDSDGSYATPLNYDYKNRPRRQEFEGYFVENGAFYITNREALLSTKNRLSGRIKAVVMSPESYVEIDEPEDWIIVENLLDRRKINNKDKHNQIKMFLCDCDGTLTDGGMYYSISGEELKKFNTRDAFGLRLLKENGITTGIITGENSEIVTQRAEKIGIDELVLGVSDKMSVVLKLCDKYGISLSNVAYIGDDLNDLEVIQNAGLGICPADACKEAKAVAAHVTAACGGTGAVREAAEYILKSMKKSER